MKPIESKPIWVVGSLLTASLLAACGVAEDRQGDRPSGPAETIVWDFNTTDSGVTALFADYAPVQDVEADFGRRALPTELGPGQGYVLSGFNRSDDLWMSISAPVTGLTATTSYQLDATITVATDAPANCFGVGGAPSSVFLKVGGIDRAPARTLIDDHYRVTYDKGAQSDGGSEVSRIAGDMGNGRDCNDPVRFESLVYRHTHPGSVRPNADGTLWIVVGTDSGFESRTTLYYQKVEVSLTPLEP